MAHRIVWVHGIGHHAPGYSTTWRAAFDPYLRLPAESYLEVCWDSVFQQAAVATLSEEAVDSTLALTPAEQLAEDELRTELNMIILARESALRAADAPPSDPALPGVLGDGDSGVVEWSEVYGAAEAAGTLSNFNWLFNPNEYLGDFTKYLVSRNVRNAIKEQLKSVMRPLVGQGHFITVVGHSWGTVVAYDSLLDLEAELPGLPVAALLTLGSPLWLVRRLLEDSSGRRPRQLGRWVNVHARKDLVGSWLKPGFRVDLEYQVPIFGDDAHNSYFAPGNLAVQRDIAAPLILG